MDLTDRFRTTDLQPCAACFTSDREWFHGMTAAIDSSEEATRELRESLLGTVR
jgi:hypothetical protein